MFYDLLGETYDDLIDWPARLAKDVPALERLFASVGVSLIADVGCGTGEYALALAHDGFEILGLDISETLIRIAENKAKVVERRPIFVCRSLTDLPNPQPMFDQLYDGILCIGNTLPHVLDRPQVRKHVALAARYHRRGGLYVLQVVNYGKIAIGEAITFPDTTLPDGAVVKRIQQRVSDTHARLLIERIDPAGHDVSRDEHAMLVWRAPELEALFESAGYHLLNTWENIGGAPFDPQTSPGLVMVFERE